MRAIWSTLILSGAAASAIALAQSADKPDYSNKQPQAAVDANDFAPALAGDNASTRTLSPSTANQLYSSPVPIPATTGGFAAPYHGVHPASTVYAARPLSPEEQRQAKEFREAVEQLRRAQSDFEKTAARDRLSQLISAQLDRDLEQREKKLAEIEARAKELRDQLEQRRSSKGEIQKMLMLMIESPETGLGLPPAWMSSLMQPGITSAPAYAAPSYGGGLIAPGSIPQSTSSSLPLGSTLPPASAK